MTTIPSFMKSWWSIFTDQEASTRFTEGARKGAMGCHATMRHGGFTSAGMGGATSPGLVGGGGGTFSGSAGGGGGTSSLPRFLDGSLDAMRLLEEEEALGFTSW
jgi:hypothetical protein